MKARNFVFILILMALAGVVLLICNLNSAPAAKDTCTVALVANKGMEILSANPVEIHPGENASFQITFKDRYFYSEQEGVTYSDGTLSFSGVTKDTSLYYTPGHNCSISISTTEGGSASLLSEAVLQSGSIAEIAFAPQEHYEAAQILVNSTSYPVPRSGNFSFTVEDDSVVEISFVGETVNFMAMSNQIGEVKLLNDTSDFHYGDTIRLATNYDNSSVRFYGFSKNGYIEDGGEVISESETLDYPIYEDTILYANFKDISTYHVLIDANGGSLGWDISQYDLSPSTYVNLPVDQGALSKEGYILTGYNSQADGNGTHYSLGGMIVVPRSDSTYYAEWTACTTTDQLSYYNNGNGITITGYAEGANRDAETLCIPRTIDGLKVTAIAANAFANCDSLCTAIVPINVNNIDSYAFGGCDALTRVYLPETLTYLATDAFNDSTGFTSLRILACQNRVYDYDFDSAMADKYMRLKTTQGKRIIVVGGSSVAFGLNSPMLEDAFLEYTSVNFGCSFLYGAIPLFEMLKANIHEGDVVIFAPEYYSTMYAQEQDGTFANWQYLESNYDILDDINIRTCSNILNTFTAYLAHKSGYLPDGKRVNSDSTYVRSGMNAAGDLTIARTNQGFYQPDMPEGWIASGSGMERYNECCRVLTEKGAKCLFSFPPMSNGGASYDFITERASDFMNSLTSNLNSEYCTVISKFADYCLNQEYYYDSMYHLTLEGAELRTKQLINDLEQWGGM